MPVPAVRCPPEVCLICTKGWKIFSCISWGMGCPSLLTIMEKYPGSFIPHGGIKDTWIDDVAYFTALLNRLLRILVRASLSTGALKSCSGRSV